MMNYNEPRTALSMTAEEFDIVFNDGRVCPYCDIIFPNQDERDLHVMREEEDPSQTGKLT